jgi:hypothetical protein
MLEKTAVLEVSGPLLDRMGCLSAVGAMLDRTGWVNVVMVGLDLLELEMLSSPRFAT